MNRTGKWWHTYGLRPLPENGTDYVGMETKPIKIVVYHCRNLQLFNNGNQKALARRKPGLKLVPIPCSGKVEAHHLLKTLAAGTQGVLVVACEEKACRFVEGSMRSHKRVDYARSWLEELGIEQERVEYVHVPPRDLDALERLIDEFKARVEALGNMFSERSP